MELASGAEIPVDIGSRFVAQFVELWINPEIQRRRNEGVLLEDFALFAAQVIINFDQPTAVRLNEEVKAAVVGTFSKLVEEGTQVSIDELDSITGVELTNRDPNAGHLTVLFHKGSWFVAFDFRYNAAICADHLAIARGFLDAARFSLDHQHVRVAIDNLYSATELMAKSCLLMHDQKILTSRTHGIVHARFNQWGYLGNVSPRYTALLNRLAETRVAAKYFRGQFDVTSEAAENLLEVAEEMYSEQVVRIPNRHL